MSAVTAPSPVRGSGAMRVPVYLIAIASCLVLSGLMAGRENWLGMTLVLLAALAYSVRLVTITRRERRAQAEAARGPKARTTAEQAALVSELRQMREHYDRIRRWMLLIAMMVAGLAALAWTWNPAFALALVLFSIPPLVLAWKNSRAVRKIDEGLARAR